LFEDVGAVGAEAAQLVGEAQQEALHALQGHGIHGGASGLLVGEGLAGEEPAEGGALPRDDAAEVPGDLPVIPGALGATAALGPALPTHERSPLGRGG
jgi:hypothetical protein